MFRPSPVDFEKVRLSARSVLVFSNPEPWASYFPQAEVVADGSGPFDVVMDNDGRDVDFGLLNPGGVWVADGREFTVKKL